MAAWLPQTRQAWVDHTALQAELGLLALTEAARLERNASWLISRLYVPDSALGACVTSAHLKALGLAELSGEAINWGDLSAIVEPVGADAFLVTIAEAAPDASGLQQYIETWLRRWGWENIVVKTEW